MRALFFIDSLGSGGAQRQIINLATGFTDRGYDVDLVIYHEGSNFFRDLVTKSGINLIAIDSRSGFSLSVLICLIKRLYFIRYVAAISFLRSPNIYLCLAKILSFTSVPIIVSERSCMKYDTNRLSSFLCKILYSAADFVVSNSLTNSSYLAQSFWLRPKVKTIYNGFKLKPYNSFCRQTISSSNFSLLVVGRINYVKNGLRLLRALLLFNARNGFIPQLYWVGRQDSDFRSLSLRSDMDDLISNHPCLSTNVHFVGECKDINPWIEKTHVLIHVSLYEGLPNAICEAFINGQPVIASNVCDHPDLLKDGQRGILCDPQSELSICSAIESFYSLPPIQRHEMTSSARLFAEKNLSFDLLTRNFISLIR